MPIYASATDVRSLIAVPFTRPTDEQIDVIIDGIESDVHEILSRAGATVPLTAASHVAMVRLKIMFGAAAIAYVAAFPGGEDTRQVRQWNKAFDSFMADLKAQRTDLGNPTRESVRTVTLTLWGRPDDGTETEYE